MLTGLLAVAFLFTIPVLLILIINAMIKVGTLQKNLEKLEKEFWVLRRQIQETKEGIEQDWKETEESSPAPAPVAEETHPEPAPVHTPESKPTEVSSEWKPPTPPEPTLEPSPKPKQVVLPTHIQPTFQSESKPQPDFKEFQPTKPAAEPSLEMLLGTRWLSTVGIIMLLFAAGFFLKYAYDNAWIGPQGRLAIGTLAGIVALGLGERFRRKQWDVLFQTLTGGGLATFYLCIFFSFQIYHLTGQSVSMTLATAVTAFAVGLAVFHNALSIASLAIIGGFLSPILLSSGENHPYALFTYIAVLDLVALGAAGFRRWRALDLLCFLGTSLIFLLWFVNYYDQTQMTPALIYCSLFYSFFLVIPSLYGLLRRTEITVEGLGLIVVNTLYAFIYFYFMLFSDYRHTLGGIVFGMAGVVFAIYALSCYRIGRDSKSAQVLLATGLGLVTLLIPIELRLYALPIAWAVEGVLLVYLGIRYQSYIKRMAGGLALFLAIIGLLARLPLHRDSFIPLLNVPFGSWTTVIIAILTTAIIATRNRKSDSIMNASIAGTSWFSGISLLCLLLSLEMWSFWQFNYPRGVPNHQFSSMLVLWSILPILILYVFRRKKLVDWIPFALLAYAIGAGFFLVGFLDYKSPSSWLMLNDVFPFRLCFIGSLLIGSRLALKMQREAERDILEFLGQVFLTLLIALEFIRWSHQSHLIDIKMGISLISVAWAVQAFLLVWLGLLRRSKLHRYLGFALFALTVGKTLLIDMSEVEKIYRIVSFFVSGLLLLAAGYFYQRLSNIVLGSSTERNPEESESLKE